MAFRDGILVFRQPGALPAPALDEIIEAVKGLDMDEVRAKVAEQEAAEANGEAITVEPTEENTAAKPA
jgi:thioredoxin 1